MTSEIIPDGGMIGILPSGIGVIKQRPLAFEDVLV